MDVLAVVGLYIAGIIGAGFASGKELTVFFVNYGSMGLLGVGLALVLFIAGTTLILEHASKHRVNSYEGIFAAFGPFSGELFDRIYTFFLVIGTSVMLAGSAAMGASLFTQVLFRYGTAILVFLVLQKGISGPLKSGTFLAPFIVLILLVLALGTLRKDPPRLPGMWRGGALEAGILYAAYNLGFSVPLLASVHGYLKTKRERWMAMVLGNLSLGLVMVVLYFALLGLPKEALRQAFPLQELALNKGRLALFFYRVALWAAMFTTATANSLALLKRLNQTRLGSWTTLNIVVTISSLALSYLGFGVLVEVAYPFLGLLGLWILAGLLRLALKKDTLP